MRLGRQLFWIPVAGAVIAWCVAVPQPMADSRPHPKLTSMTPKPVSSEPIDTVSFQGTYVASQTDQVTLRPGDSGRVRRILVKVGDRVLKGQTLAVLELGTNIRESEPRFNAKSESAHAEQLSDALGAALTSHEEALKTAQKVYASAKAEHDAKVAQAQQELDRALNGAPREQFQRAQQAVDDAKTARDKAKTLSDHDQHAYEEGWISRNQATASRIAYEKAESVLQSAESKLAELKKGPNDDQIRAAKDDYSRTKTQEDTKLQAIAEKLAEVQNGGLAFGSGDRIAMPALSAPIDPKLAGKISGSTALRAPFDGTVTNLSEQGKPLTIVLVKEGAAIEFVGNLAQTQADKLCAGMAVRLPGGEMGSIKSLDSKASNESKQIDVHIACYNHPPAGTQGTASIVLRTPLLKGKGKSS